MSAPADSIGLPTRAGAPAAAARRIGRALPWIGMLALVLWGARTDSYSVDSDLAYWLGVTGGSAMLLLLLYPLRKRIAEQME